MRTSELDVTDTGALVVDTLGAATIGTGTLGTETLGTETLGTGTLDEGGGKVEASGTIEPDDSSKFVVDSANVVVVLV